MTFFEILIILLFVVLPLLQAFLEKQRGGAPEEGAPEEAPPEPRGVPQPRPVPRTEPRGEEPAETIWSADWGEWPQEAEEAAAAEPAEAEPLMDELRDVRSRRTLEPEAVRVASQVVSLEPLHVDRAAEHKRLHATLAEDSPERRREPARVVNLLGGPDDLRRAVLLSEILGPPIALREPGAGPTAPAS